MTFTDRRGSTCTTYVTNGTYFRRVFISSIDCPVWIWGHLPAKSFVSVHLCVENHIQSYCWEAILAYSSIYWNIYFIKNIKIGSKCTTWNMQGIFFILADVLRYLMRHSRHMFVTYIGHRKEASHAHLIRWKQIMFERSSDHTNSWLIDYWMNASQMESLGSHFFKKVVILKGGARTQKVWCFNKRVRRIFW